MQIMSNYDERDMVLIMIMVLQTMIKSITKYIQASDIKAKTD